MMNLACWAVPIRDGYVLRADRSTAAILQVRAGPEPTVLGLAHRVDPAAKPAVFGAAGRAGSGDGGGLRAPGWRRRAK